LQQRVATAAALLDGAEQRFIPPDRQWFADTQQALREESQRMQQVLAAEGPDVLAQWQAHLHWPLLEKNLGAPDTIDFNEIALVRRWMYSNRKGLETPQFAELRQATQDYTDAAYAFTQGELELQFQRQVELARQQMWALALEPSDAQAAALGRTLGWLDQTRQLPQETAAVRALLLRPNAQLRVAKPLLDRVLGLLASDVQQTLAVTDQVTVPNGNLLGMPRQATVRGTATTHGKIGLDLTESLSFAALELVYLGQIESRCKALIGPLTVAMQTTGPVRAVTPIEIRMTGVELAKSQVSPDVQTRVTGVFARRELIRRLGERRVYDPESLQNMKSRAREKAATVLEREMESRVNSTIDEVRAEFQQAQSSMNGFQEVLAPVEREGASPRWAGLQSSAESVIVNALSQRREQWGAVTACPLVSDADLQVRLHVSFFNNLAETIMAGKTFTDKYFMNYGKIIQANLPPALMVHARSQPWAIVAAKPRPLEITIPAPNRLRMQLNIQRVEIGEEQYTGPTVATIHYQLVKNDFDEYELERQGEVELDSSLPPEAEAFLLSKFDAFFAPVLNGGGVALPEGGALGRLQGLVPRGAVADQNWLLLGIDIPSEFLKSWLPIPPTAEPADTDVDTGTDTDQVALLGD
jgi:hypothetical protein